MSQPQIDVPFPNAYWVLPGQFLAGEHPVEFSDIVTLARLTSLLDAGVQTFVNLTEERERMPNYAAVLHDLAQARQVNLEVLRMPIPDRRVPSVELLKSILDVIDDSLARHKPVYVHCFAGIGRTGTIVGCYLKRHRRATTQDVIERISKLRRQMPFGGEPSPHTPEQIQLVENWPEES
jgi:protein-tyrosine phosphatase